MAIVGGSYVGIELACNLATWLRRDQLAIDLVHRDSGVLGGGADFNREVAERRLREAGVTLHLDTSVERVEPSELSLRPAAAQSEPYGLPSDLIVWAAGSRPSSLAMELGLPTDDAGRVRVDSSLRVRGRDALWSLGDVAEIADATGAAPPSTASAAMQQADYVAWNVRAAIRGAPPVEFRYAALGEVLSLGGAGADASASVSALGGIKLEGPLASASRRALYAARMPTATQAARVGVSWLVEGALGAVRELARRAEARTEAARPDGAVPKKR